jgi:hypothetical protein
MKLEINGPKLVIAGVVLVGLIWLFSRGCGGGNSAALTAANNKADSAIAASAYARQEAAKKDDTLRMRGDTIRQLLINNEAFAEETNKAYDAAANAQDKTKQFQNKYETARKQLDTVLALASCDSLTLAIVRERIKATAAQKACKDQINGLGDLLSQKNKDIGTLTRQVQALRQPANIVSDALHAVKAATKEPWIKGYVGASVMGNQTSFGFGPDVTLLFKRGVMVRGGALLMGSQVMGVVGVSKLLSFKKK